MLDAAADRIVGAIEGLDEVWDQLPRPEDLDERQEHRLPYDQLAGETGPMLMKSRRLT